MTWQTWAWLAWAVAFAAVEAVGLAQKDRPNHPRTLSAHIWWLVRGAGLWHHVARVGVALLLAWLTGHLLGGAA